MIAPNPQPLEILKQRFKTVFREVYDVQKVIDNKQEAPSGKAEHIFDFEHGLRIIASRDKYKEMEVLHFSASTFGDYEFAKHMPMRLALAAFLGECTGFICQLSGCKTNDLELIAITPEKGVPHWIIKLANLN